MDVNNLQDHFLISLDRHPYSTYHHALVYLCDHSATGAMGLVVNRDSGLVMNDVLQSLHINASQDLDVPVLRGGPVENNVGFVLHHDCGQWYSSLHTSRDLTVTTSPDVLEAIAHHEGPEKSLLTLGYSGWKAGQLEQELAKNFWLACPANEDILFNTPIEQRWQAALELLGFRPEQLVHQVGHA